MEFAWDLALKFDTVHDVGRTCAAHIIHSRAHNPAFCSGHQPLLQSSRLSPKAAESDLGDRAGGILAECLVCAPRVHTRETSGASRGRGIYCAPRGAPKRFRFEKPSNLDTGTAAVAHAHQHQK